MQSCAPLVGTRGRAVAANDLKTRSQNHKDPLVLRRCKLPLAVDQEETIAAIV